MAERTAVADKNAASSKKRETEDAAKAAVKACDSFLRSENQATAMNVVEYIASNANVNEYVSGRLFGGQSNLIVRPIDEKL